MELIKPIRGQLGGASEAFAKVVHGDRFRAYSQMKLKMDILFDRITDQISLQLIEDLNGRSEEKEREAR